MTKKHQATTWVSPIPTSESLQAPRRTPDDVWVQVLQNAVGALGVAGLATLGAWWMTGGDWQASAMAGLMGGLLVFCLALAIRSFWDEGQMVARAMRKEAEARGAVDAVEAEWAERLDAAEAALHDAIAEIDHLEAVVEGLRTDRDMAMAELQQFRSRVEVNFRSKASLYDKARKDAKELIKLTLTPREGKPVTWIARDVATAELNWSRDRWEDAFTLLKDAGVVMQHGAKGNHVRILVKDLAQAFAVIDKHTGAVSLSEE
jgi:hypothetical protein